MCWLLIPLFAGLLASEASADTAKVAPERISAVVTSDWNNDGRFDRAVLIEADDAVDLLIYLSDSDDAGARSLAPVARRASQPEAHPDGDRVDRNPRMDNLFKAHIQGLLT